MPDFDLQNRTKATGLGFSFGDIVPDIVVEEDLYDELAITQHPVEQGAAITDHAFKQPPAIVMRYGFSNSGEKSGGDKNYVTRVYSAFLKLQLSRVPFTINTLRRAYKNMLINSLSVKVDEKTRYALFIEARARQIQLVQTAIVSVPPRAAQAIPESTTPTEERGTVQPRTSTLYNGFGGAAPG